MRNQGTTRSISRAVVRSAKLVLLVLVLAGLGGCTYTVQPVGGVEGQTSVYAAIGKDGAPNSGIVVTQLGAVVIDPGLNPDVGGRLRDDALLKSRVFWDNLWRRRNEKPPTLPPPVLYVINTTYRSSHSFGNQEFLERAEIIATERAGKQLANIDTVRKMRQILSDEFKVPGLERHQMAEPTLTFEGTMTIKTPEAEIKCISAGDCVGEGDAVVFLPQQKVLFAGDLVLVGFMPYPGGRTRTVRNWIKALKRFQELDVRDVIPGHGEMGGKELIQKQIDFLTALVLEVSMAKKKGLSVEDAMKQVKLPNYANWSNYDKWLPENVRIVYEELGQAAPREKDDQTTDAGGSMAAPNGVKPADPYTDR